MMYLVLSSIVHNLTSYRFVICLRLRGLITTTTHYEWYGLCYGLSALNAFLHEPGTPVTCTHVTTRLK